MTIGPEDLAATRRRLNSLWNEMMSQPPDAIMTTTQGSEILTCLYRILDRLGETGPSNE